MNVPLLLCSVVVVVVLLSGCIEEPFLQPRPGPAESPGAVLEPTPEMTSPPPAAPLVPAPDTTPGGKRLLSPGGIYHTGDRILISGVTNLAPGNEVMIEVRSRSFGPTDKHDPTVFSGASAVVVVEEGVQAGKNTVTYAIDTTAFTPDEYEVVISGLTVPAFRETATFTLIPAE